MKPGYKIKNNISKAKLDYYISVHNFPTLNEVIHYGWQGNYDDVLSDKTIRLYGVGIWKIKYKTPKQ